MRTSRSKRTHIQKLKIAMEKMGSSMTARQKIQAKKRRKAARARVRIKNSILIPAFLLLLFLKILETLIENNRSRQRNQAAKPEADAFAPSSPSSPSSPVPAVMLPVKKEWLTLAAAEIKPLNRPERS